ncbi:MULTISPECIES: NEW3 domain-containing protein [Thermus]|uniref:ABC transporter substrate-binding protein n=1 Tax=Thermus scotoductus TaxID=37636 RepID=A0A430V236_THESC|nr:MULTISPECIES: NEW3 domain-containing protein [Thermus]RTG95467.1 ABC transporter substrate-binding protein [Thermus scotoductus]RTH06790.1 ABC transporter substrate-binding protein [Thermus scotoductus]RTH18366.1 ABC transporter substrate-binding protein [Thermus scotoductus]RTH23046.1 ABC transporter substrate-binding protein [Thermus scotoductus]RTI00147.1 ABC transporter substrate-binding protein [Thermus scotoductus]
MVRKLLTLVLLGFGVALAQAQGFRGLSLGTSYPEIGVQPGESVNLTLTLKNYGLPPGVVRVQVAEAPQGWQASLIGGGRLVRAVYLAPDGEATLTLRLQPPKEVKPGTYRFLVRAEGLGQVANLPIGLVVGQGLPQRLSLEAELPILKGPPTSSFRYRVTLKNESDRDLLVSLEYEAPKGWQVTFTPAFSSQQVTSLPIKAGESKDLDVEVSLPKDTKADTYGLTLRAVAGEAKAELALTLEVTGRPEVRFTTKEGRLSGQVVAGRENAVKLVVKNEGSAPAKNLSFSAMEPSGWEVKFEPEKLDALEPGQEQEVTARIKPSPKAVTGDYMVTLSLSGSDGLSESLDYRATVVRSSLWGLVGVGIMAVALLVLGFAVNRFGRR